MKLDSWKIVFKPGWDIYFRDFDKSEQQKIMKKIDQMEQPLQARGLHSSRYCVEETGQYRIAFYQDGNHHTKEIHFVGNHKQYRKWYSKI